MYSFVKIVAVASVFALPNLSFAASLDPVGGGQSVSTVQPSLALTPIMRVSGVFQDLGQVKWFAGNFAPRGYVIANGQTLDIASNTALFSTMGTTYGGDGRTTFKVPDLRGRAVIGAGQTYQRGAIIGNDQVTLTQNNLPAHTHLTADGLTSTSTGVGTAFNNMQPGIALDYEIVKEGIFPSRGGSGSGFSDQTLAFVKMDAASKFPEDRNVFDANGDLLSISSNTALFSLLGTTYGGDGRTTFGVPDTEDSIIVGAGTGPGLPRTQLGAMSGSTTTQLSLATMPAHAHGDEPGIGDTDPAGLGQPVSNVQPELALNYVIGLQGLFPSRGPGGTSSEETFLGEIGLFAGNFAPSGFALAEGQLLAISSNSALFSILGTTYGGDGRTTFALPDLRGRTAIGAGAGLELTAILGGKYGSENLFLTQNNLPSHTHDVERVAPVPLPAGIWVLGSALAMLSMAGVHGRRRKS